MCVNGYARVSVSYSGVCVRESWYVCIWMCVHASMHMCVSRYAHLCGWMWRLKVNIDVFFLLSLDIASLRQGLSLNLKLTFSARVAASEPGIFLFLLPSLESELCFHACEAKAPQTGTH